MVNYTMLAAGTFWEINLGHVIILVGMLSGFVLWFSRFEGKIRSTSEALSTLTTQTAKTLNELAHRVEDMDKEGTRKSQQELATKQKLDEVTLKRLDNLESISASVSPKVAAIARDVEWLVHYIQNGCAPRSTEKVRA